MGLSLSPPADNFARVPNDIGFRTVAASRRIARASLLCVMMMMMMMVVRRWRNVKHKDGGLSRVYLGGYVSEALDFAREIRCAM